MSSKDIFDEDEGLGLIETVVEIGSKRDSNAPQAKFMGMGMKKKGQASSKPVQESVDAFLFEFNVPEGDLDDPFTDNPAPTAPVSMPAPLKNNPGSTLNTPSKRKPTPVLVIVPAPGPAPAPIPAPALVSSLSLPSSRSGSRRLVSSQNAPSAAGPLPSDASKPPGAQKASNSKPKEPKKKTSGSQKKTSKNPPAAHQSASEVNNESMLSAPVVLPAAATSLVPMNLSISSTLVPPLEPAPAAEPMTEQVFEDEPMEESGQEQQPDDDDNEKPLAQEDEHEEALEGVDQGPGSNEQRATSNEQMIPMTAAPAPIPAPPAAIICQTSPDLQTQTQTQTQPLPSPIPFPSSGPTSLPPSHHLVPGEDADIIRPTDYLSLIRSLEMRIVEAQEMQDDSVDLSVRIAMANNRLIMVDNPIVRRNLKATREAAERLMGEINAAAAEMEKLKEYGQSMIERVCKR